MSVLLVTSLRASTAWQHLLHPVWEAVWEILFSASLATMRQPKKKVFKSILRFIIYGSAFWDCKSHCPWKDKHHLKMRNETQFLFPNLRYLIKSCKFDSQVIYKHVILVRLNSRRGGRCFNKEPSVYHNKYLFFLSPPPNFDIGHMGYTS